ncbi:hypothetical protein [Amycolatopsis methanolica]|uniref:Uncharacterized protein n=1 Tax=Amycolatopsis methanolica 239 TaxID=1068978 RepID=A0A076MMW3_AMYME|nr:hypothetical protein [Amycolatopsis methanolica]AIJ22173.1 hypothetical protein AMETH_2081 [Amycolatopsis methanolica 239]
MNAGQYPPSRPQPPAQAMPRPMPPAQAQPGPPPAQQQQQQHQHMPPGQAVLGAPAMPQAPAVVNVAAPAPQTQQAGSAEAAAATTVEVARPALAVGVPTPMPPQPPGPGPAAGAAREHRDWRTRRHRSIPRLRIGAHHASDSALELLQVSASSVGLPLGRDQNGFPVALTLFRPEPVSVSLIGGAWAARLMAYRALRAGARLLVFSQHPADWVQLGQSATGRTDRVAVVAPGSPPAVTASADAPVLCLHDAPQSQSEPEAWQTRVLLHRRLTPDRVGAVPGSDLVLMQRLTPNEASLLAPALRLAQRTTQQLQMLRDDMLAVLAGETNHYVWVDPAPAERARLGRPGRY